MAQGNIIEFPVPEGFPPMSLPTKADTRIPDSKILLQYVEEKDMPEFVAICYEAFPDLFYDMVENVKTRPPLEERIKLLSKHFNAVLGLPGYHFIKAVHGDTGEIMGVATWHENVPQNKGAYPTSFPGYDVKFPSHFVPCCWRDDLVKTAGLGKKQGWTDDDVQEMYGYHTPEWGGEFKTYDTGRVKEVGEAPHWYLAPLACKVKFQGKGVGKLLLKWAIDRADAAQPPMACVLEALPNARPVYYHMGFEPTETHGAGKDTQLVRPAKSS